MFKNYKGKRRVDGLPNMKFREAKEFVSNLLKERNDSQSSEVHT